jgi:DNA-directed RNA polymerase subunit RPC12/RpoP
MSTCVFACEACGRTITAKLEVAIKRVESGRMKCQYCGGKLGVPPQVAQALASKSELESLEGRDELLVYSCSKCQRPIKRPLHELIDLLQRCRTKCQLCGSEMVFPPEVAAARQGAQARGKVQLEAQAKDTAMHAVAHVRSGPGRVEFPCPACEIDQVAAQNLSASEQRCVDCNQLIIVPHRSGAPVWDTPGVPTTLGPTRAEIARRVLTTTPPTGVKVEVALHFICQHCGSSFSHTDLQSSSSPHCLRCRKGVWTIKLEVTVHTPSEAANRARAAGKLAAGIIGMGLGIKGSANLALHAAQGNETEGANARYFDPNEPLGCVVGGISPAGVAEVLKDPTPKDQIPARLLPFLDRLERRHVDRVLEVMRRAGVHCLACGIVFPPALVLNKVGIPGLSEFTSNTACTPKCEQEAFNLSQTSRRKVEARCGMDHVVLAPETHLGKLMLCQTCGGRLLVREA